MYKKMRNFLFLITLTSVVIVIILTFLVDYHMIASFKTEYKALKIHQTDYYFNGITRDFENIINAHAIWEDSIDALDKGDFDWLYENATGYIVEDSDFNIDYLFISDESDNNKQSYGEIYIDNIDERETYKEAMVNNESFSEVIWYEGEALFLYSSPLFDDDRNNPTGCYILGRILGSDEINDLTALLSDKHVENIILSKNVGVNDSSFDEVRVTYTLDDDNKVYLKTLFTIEHFTKPYNNSIGIIVIIIIVVALCASLVVIINIKKLSAMLSEIIKTVKRISVGEHHVKMTVNKKSIMPEVNQLIDSVNVMSSDIEAHISKIEDHARVIDQQYINMIELLVNTVEMNDSYTYRHSLSVAEYALILGDAIEYEEMEDLVLAAQLHDVGKISISTEILNKPGKLTAEEYNIIKKHSQNGYDLLNKVEQFEKAKEGVLYHHERYDGKGYPLGLLGDEIPIMAQIIAVADIYDALTSDRAYRMAIDCHAAMDILFEEKGKALNPELVDIFYEEMKKKDCSASNK